MKRFKKVTNFFIIIITSTNVNYLIWKRASLSLPDFQNDKQGSNFIPYLADRSTNQTTRQPLSNHSIARSTGKKYGRKQALMVNKHV
jgi:hypothetical protein